MAHHSLPLLAQRTDELSKCAYCPKLCRATCVVSEVEPREALTPWGKMTNAFDAARGADITNERAELAWACSNCFRCREACDHRNPVTETLNAARADYVALGRAPASVQALLERRPSLDAELALAIARLARQPGVSADAPRALLLGCRYARVFAHEAQAAIRLAVKLSGPVRLISGCCGAWQRAAGAPQAADEARAGVARELHGVKRLLVLEPRCALELADLSPTTLVALAAQHEQRFGAAPSSAEPGAHGGSAPPAAVRYHDSCALGRGVAGSAPLELETSRELGRCSGGGGILPVSMPEVARAAAGRLASEHQRLGGGTLVTSCASSLSQLRRAGIAAVDLVTTLEGGLAGHD